MKKEYRPYVRHKWIYEGKTERCFVCGISHLTWERKIENDSMLNWDCLSVRQKKIKF